MAVFLAVVYVGLPVWLLVKAWVDCLQFEEGEVRRGKK